MVTKHVSACGFIEHGSVLAKIHMVTKPFHMLLQWTPGSVLAKIHMVTKQKIPPID